MSRLRSKLSVPPAAGFDSGLSAGMRVNDNVVLVKPIGEGAMGSVWVARHETLKTDVAVKFIGETLSMDDPDVLARFNREASTAAQIKSPYVVQTFDQGVMDGGVPYIVMELLEGVPLMDRIERDDGLGLDETEVIIAQVGKALAAAHARGIVHRDIKPQNIFLTTIAGDLHVKVFDFGIAKHTNIPTLDGITVTGEPIGTPEFMSPEQLFNAQDLDHRADLWALGVVAYCCLTGRLPFDAATLPELCKHLLQCEFPPPSSFRPELTPAVDTWFAKALHADIDERFQSAKEMAVSFVRVMAATQINEQASALEELFITVDDTVPPAPAPSDADHADAAHAEAAHAEAAHAEAAHAEAAHAKAAHADAPTDAVDRRPPGPPPSDEVPVTTRPSEPEDGHERRAWMWIPAAILVGLGLLIFRPEIGQLLATPTPSDPMPQLEEAPAVQPSASTSIVAPRTVPVPEVAPEPATVAPPTEIEGKDGEAWTRVLRGAVLRGNAKLAAEAFVAVGTLSPETFDEPKAVQDAAKAAHLAMSDSVALGDQLFTLMRGDAFGHRAADILYGIVINHSGSSAAKKATKLLDDEDVLESATPALRVALDVRHTSCRDRPALFDRAGQHGDERTLYTLLAMRSDSCEQISCCMKDNEKLVEAINGIRTRIGTGR